VALPFWLKGGEKKQANHKGLSGRYSKNKPRFKNYLDLSFVSYSLNLSSAERI
jgi:hypothetical protein